MSVSISGTVEVASNNLDVYWEEISTALTSYEIFMNKGKDDYSEKFAIQRDIRLSIDKSVSLGQKSNHFVFCKLEDMPFETANVISHSALASEEDIIGVHIYSSETNIYSLAQFDTSECIIFAVRYNKMKRMEVFTAKELGQPQGEPTIEYLPDTDENGEQKTSMEYLFIAPLNLIGGYKSAKHFLSEFNRARTALFVAKLKEDDTVLTTDVQEEKDTEARIKAIKKRNKSIKQNITDSRNEVDFMSDPEY